MTMHRRLLHHDLVFVLLVLVFEVAPLGQDFHCLNVFNSSELFSVVLVATKSIEVDFFTKSFIFVLDNFKDVVNLLTIENLFVIHTSNRVENSPHDFWIIHSTKMITNIQAENDLV